MITSLEGGGGFLIILLKRGSLIKELTGSQINEYFRVYFIFNRFSSRGLNSDLDLKDWRYKQGSAFEKLNSKKTRVAEK